MIFISYSHDDKEHIDKVLAFSNRLRSDGFDCLIDQYEVSPSEGWPRWMDQKIKSAEYVLLICTQKYSNKIEMHEEEMGAGVKWEGNLIYQHLYDNQSLNSKFIPVVLNEEDKKFIPTPLKGASYFTFDDENYEKICKRLLNLPNAEKPPLGKRPPLPEKEVKTDFKLFFSSPIDPDLWDAAKWSATAFVIHPHLPPVFGLVFRNELAAVEIFESWRERFGKRDVYSELRVSITTLNEIPFYKVHICSDIENIIKRFKEMALNSNDDLLIMMSRINGMEPKNLDNLNIFKEKYLEHNKYILAPAILKDSGSPPKLLLEWGIEKTNLIFRKESEISKNPKDGDMDLIVIDQEQKYSIRKTRID